MARAIAIFTGVLLLVCVQLFLSVNTPIAERVANQLLGETWYRIELHGAHVGFMHNHAFQDLHGRYHFNSTTHFRLQPGKPNTVSKQLVFAAPDDYRLVHAKYVNREASNTMSVDVTRAAAGYAAAINSDGHVRTQTLDWVYGLLDFVALETWLAEAQPQPGATHLAKNPDFERLTIATQGFRIAELNPTGYLLENDAPLAAHQIQLNRNFRPHNLIMSGTFKFVATHQQEAINLEHASNVANYLFNSNQRIHDHTLTSSLEIEFLTNTEIGLEKRLVNTASYASQLGQPDDFAGGDLRYPVTMDEVQKIVAENKQANTEQKALAYALNEAVYRLLRYSANQPAGSVAEALRRGSGECTDFADLLTTLARAADLPARTVYGLVYHDAASPGFVFHAWNEVYFDGAWHAFDPTWNQTRVDATHIRLTDAQAGALMLAHSRNDVTIRVEAADYFSS